MDPETLYRTFYPLCDVCGNVISMRDGHTLGVYAVMPGETPEGFGINQARKGFARASARRNDESAEDLVCAAIGERAEATWHAGRDECDPDALFTGYLDHEDSKND